MKTSFLRSLRCLIAITWVFLLLLQAVSAQTIPPTTGITVLQPTIIPVTDPITNLPTAMGFLKREVYLDIPGMAVSNLTSSTKFPAKPDQTSLIASFEAPMDVADNYGQRISGYLIPPTNGEYVFYLASDDQSELWLSMDTTPTNKVRIAINDSWSMPREWNPSPMGGGANKRSEPITLAAGHSYYVEALMKEGGGGDNCAVAWQKPGDPPPVNGDPPIPGQYLAMTPIYHTNDLATLVITTPTEGTVFSMPIHIPIEVTATDPDGAIYRVEFYANDIRVGVSQIFTLVAPPPGTPMIHSMYWTNSASGSYTLTAKAIDTLGRTVVSAPVHITIQSPALEPEFHAVGVYSGNYHGGPSPNNLPGEAVVNVNRPGKLVTLFLSAYEPVHWQVNVADGTRVEKVILGGYYAQSLSGLGSEVEIIQAFPGGNYGQSFYAGYEIDSNQFRQTLPIIYAITGMQLSSFQGAYTAPMPDGFTIDQVQDDPRLKYYPPANQWPLVSFLSPKEGDELPVNEPILLRAYAFDPDGYVKSVEFFVNGQSIGQGFSLSSTQGVYALQWTPTTPGQYTAWAAATDDKNATSPTVHTSFNVVQPVVVSTAVRHLPTVYLANTSFQVKIVATPAPHSSAYALEDTVPWGWTVSTISHEGIFDTLSRKVKFGPFFDAEQRTLTYRVTPQDDDLKEETFFGQLSVDGKAITITGDVSIKPTRQYHPADYSPEDNRMSINEVTAYSAAWKKGEGWYVGPRPIPTTYLTRAGALWKGGEAYVFSPESGAPPYCWVNVTPYVQMTPLHAVAVVAENRIVSQLPANYTPGTALTVTLTATPRAGVLAYAVEDQPPTGWTVSSISTGGSWDAANGQVKWFFTDAQTRALTYQVTPPSNATAAGLFTGSAVFDDLSAPQTVTIQGMRQVLPAGTPAPQLGRCSQQPDGSWMLPVISAPGAKVALEVSTNAIQWESLAIIVNQTGADIYTDRSATNATLKFYRAHLEE